MIAEWIRKYDFQMKFVVSGESDLKEIKDLLSRLETFVAPPHRRFRGEEGPPSSFHRVLLMPEGIDARTLASRSPWLVEICKREGFRYCPRLQIELFGHTRGT